MAESPQQYTQRIFAALGDRDPVAVMEETPKRLAELLNSQPLERLAERPGPGKWSVAEILAHLADAEMVVGFRVRLVLGQPGVPLQAFDQDAWASFSHYHEIPVQESMQRHAVQRAANVRLLRWLTTQQFQQHGVHSERGPETVLHMVKMWAGHDLNHCAQIERILGKSAAA